MSSSAWSNGPRGASNAAEPDELMSKLFNDTVGSNLEATTYKPSPSAGAGGKSGGAWSGSGNGGNKTATMANGKDFFAELRKQLISLTDKEKAGG